MCVCVCVLINQQRYQCKNWAIFLLYIFFVTVQPRTTLTNNIASLQNIPQTETWAAYWVQKTRISSSVMNRVLIRFQKNIYCTTAITKSDSKQLVLLNCYQFFLSSTTKKQIFWLTSVLFQKLLLMSLCKLPQYVTCITLCRVHYTDSHVYTFLFK